jgi:hypothetical protein
VCAPSNAATDELLNRVLGRRLIDVHGNKYTPHVVRVGSESAVMSENAQEVRSLSKLLPWTSDITLHSCQGVPLLVYLRTTL